MSLTFLIEGFKFHKLKHQRVVEVLFLIVFAFNALYFIYPIGDSDFSALINWFYDFSKIGTNRSYLLPDPRNEAIISLDNIYFLLGKFLITVINLDLSLAYGALLYGDFLDKPWQVSIKKFFKKLPQLLVLNLLLAVPMLFSPLLLNLPILILWAKLSFAPFYMFEEKYGLSKSLGKSYNQTSGVTSIMVMTYIFLEILINIIYSLLLLFVPANPLTNHLISAFFEAMKALISGRIFGLYFIYFAKINPYFNNKNPLTALNFVKEFQALRAKINGTDSKE